MDISLSEQLKRLRKAKGNTQEELAAHIGITTQAVSKWERGEGYPDITLLPAIAAYYGASIDDLLGVGKNEREKKLNAYREKDMELFRQGKSAERVALMREAIKEFPNDLETISGLMWALSAEDRKKNADEIISCGKRILDESTDSSQRNGAIHCLCFAYYYGKKDAESAIRYAESAGTNGVSVSDMKDRFLEGDEAVKYCQQNIQDCFEKIRLNAEIMCFKGKYSPEESIRVYKFLIQCYDLLYSDGNCGFQHSRYADLYSELARSYHRLGDAENAIAFFGKAAEHAVRFDTRKEERFAYTAFMVNKVRWSARNEYKNYVENQSGLLLKHLQKDEYADLLNNPRMKKIIAKLKQVAIT